MLVSQFATCTAFIFYCAYCRFEYETLPQKLSNYRSIKSRNLCYLRSARPRFNLHINFVGHHMHEIFKHWNTVRRQQNLIIFLFIFWFIAISDIRSRQNLMVQEFQMGIDIPSRATSTSHNRPPWIISVSWNATVHWWNHKLLLRYLS